MKTIIFDWGGVILREYNQPDNIGKYYCDRDAIMDTIKYFNNNLSNKEAYNIYLDTLKDENNICISAQNDIKLYNNWYERIKKAGNLNCTYEEFIDLFEKNYKKIDKYDEVVEYIYTLKNKANLYLLSDLIFVCYESLKAHINLDAFNRVFLSYDEHYLKNDINAFINVENKLNVNPNDILLIDNNEINIKKAKERGWNTLLATGYDIDKIKTTIDKFLN